MSMSSNPVTNFLEKSVQKFRATREFGLEKVAPAKVEDDVRADDTRVRVAPRIAPTGKDDRGVTRLIRLAEQASAKTATALWPLVQKFNQRFERPSPQPKWAPAPLMKRR